MTFHADIKAPLSNESRHQFTLNVSSENYLKAELTHPVRFTYTTTMNDVMDKTLLVEQIDRGKNNKHNLLWLDWNNKETFLFEKKGEGKANQNDEKKISDIPEPLLVKNPADLVYKESGDKISRSMILDPLSLIYYLRTMSPDDKTEISIAVSDDIRIYAIEPLGKKIIEINDSQYQSRQYKIKTHEKKDNFYYVWLNDNKKRIPLKFMMDAPLGKLLVELVNH